MRTSTLEVLEPRRLFNGLPTISAGDATVVEGHDGTRNAAVVVSLSGTRPKQTVTVNYVTRDGSAAAGADYVAAAGKVSFAPGETRRTILIPIKGDRLSEADEYFLVNLSGAKGGKIARAQGAVAIADDEARVSVNYGYTPVKEGNSGATPVDVVVTLAAAYDAPVTVDYATADGSATAGSGDYAAASGTLTFAAGVTSRVVTVLVNGDRVAEQDEYFYVNLSNPSSNAAISGGGVALLGIADDDPLIYVTDATNYGDRSPFVFTVSLTAAADQDVTVRYGTVDGTALAGADYVAASGTLTFLAGETTKIVSVDVLDPTSVPDKYFFVVLSDATNAPISSGTAGAYWYYDYGYYDGGGGWYYDPGYYYY